MLREYKSNPEHTMCRASSDACFANSGGFAGHPRMLARFVSDWLQAMPATQGNVSVSADDQEVLHRVFLRRHTPNVNVRLDGRSAIFLNLYRCRRSIDCMHPGGESERDVLHHVRATPQGVQCDSLRADQPATIPWVAHSNGQGKAARMAQLIAIAKHSANLSRAHAVRSKPDAEHEHPILLIDATENDGCSISSATG